MHTISSPLAVTITWHLPDADSIEATVDLRDTRAPGGRAVRAWHIETEPGVEVGVPNWSSARATDTGRLNRRARIRVTRHDGPRLLRVCVVDAGGARFTQMFRFDR